MSEAIGQTGLTLPWLESALKSSELKTNRHLLSCSVESIGAFAAFLSEILRVKLVWSDGADEVPTSVVLKMPSLIRLRAMSEHAEGEKPMDSFLIQVHEQECKFYTLWQKTSAPLQIPKCFFSQGFGDQDRGILLLSDLSDIGVAGNLKHSLSLEQVLGVVEALAHLHCWSLTHDGWQADFHPLEKEQLKFEPEFVNNFFQKVKEMWPKHFNDLDDEVMDFCESFDDFYYIYHGHQTMDVPPVLVHGDLASNNLVFGKSVVDKQIDSSLVGILDWQFSHAGLMTEDLCRLLLSSVSCDLRRSHQNAILAHYHHTLADDLRLKNREMPFSFVKLLDAFHLGLQHGMITSVGLLAMHALAYGDKEPSLDALLSRLRFVIEDTVPYLQAQKDS